MTSRLAFCLAFVALLAAATPAHAQTIDRIAAGVENQVITLTEVEQLATIRVLNPRAEESDTAYRRRILDALIAQMLRYRDVERFGAEDVTRDAIESRIARIAARHSSEAAFLETLARVELTLDELRALVKRQLQVEAYIDERYAPLVFVSLEEIENYYNQTWLPQRIDRGLPPVPLPEAREEIRALLKAERVRVETDEWTAQLRARANVDVYVFR
ncbi:MAG: SurA N-terminal domain-containing protein [Thermoanaerobaculia bacterium]